VAIKRRDMKKWSVKKVKFRGKEKGLKSSKSTAKKLFPPAEPQFTQEKINKDEPCKGNSQCG